MRFVVRMHASVKMPSPGAAGEGWGENCVIGHPGAVMLGACKPPHTIQNSASPMRELE